MEMTMQKQRAISSFEYKNDFFYIVIRQAPELGPQTYIYCCGINMPRFDPICWGKAGICSNPAFKGLQQLRADVSAYGLKLGIVTKNAERIPCGPMTPKGGTGWYRENAMLIESASPKAVQRLLEFSARDLVQTIFTVCAPDARVPAKLPNPPAMQKFIESLGVKNYKAAAPQIIARPEKR
jgi:hypothetical protein